MSETKGSWTPGPWRLQTPEEYVAGLDENGTDEGEDEIIADDEEAPGEPWHICRTHGFSDLDHALANARLIAEAPEMAKLLERWCLLSNALYVDTEMVSATEAETRALLAKLKGD